ncbi:MAG: hypothetical protein A2293_05105, partial [Elusimicrobia bacterium RIFOXYB2_FULL_49_7]
MNFITLFLVLVFAPALLFAQIVSLSEFPKRLQLFARDAQDSAVVTMSGCVTTAGFDSVSVRLYKNGVLSQRLADALTYVDDSAFFSFSPKIHAELASYKVEFYIGSALNATADSLLCGDAYLVDGQSNAQGSEVTYYSPWLRTFALSDTAWHRGSSSSWNIGQSIIVNHAVPVCFFNGAVGATGISQHMRDTTLSSIYGKLLFRITRAGLRNGIKAMFWYQGESESREDSLYNAVGYADLFELLHNAWMGDCPSITHFYVFQIRPGCGSVSQNILRDCQRRLPDRLPDVSLMSTTNVAGRATDNCHFLPTGYAEMGSWMYRLLARDFYGSDDTLYITPPNIQRAWYADEARTQLLLQFDQPVLLPSDTTMKRYFSVGRQWDVADSLSADTANRTVTLYMRSGMSEGDRVSYIPAEYDPFTGANYNGPWLSSIRGIGPLTFFQFTIEN